MKKLVVAKGVVAVCLLLCGIMACETNTATTAEETAPTAVAEEASPTTVKEEVSYSTSGTHAGHDYVDMGLSVKWATMNVGASSPGDYGNYYAWGETATKQRYDEDNCATWEKEIGDISGTSRDIAHAEWGGSWRMPTRAEFRELLDEVNCTWEWSTLDGHRGYKVRSKKTGNWIFLPAAGWWNGTSLGYADEYGSYWSSTPYESGFRHAYRLGFYGGHRDCYWICRNYGRSVRPVGGF